MRIVFEKNMSSFYSIGPPKCSNYNFGGCANTCFWSLFTVGHWTTVNIKSCPVVIIYFQNWPYNRFCCLFSNTYSSPCSLPWRCSMLPVISEVVYFELSRNSACFSSVFCRWRSPSPEPIYNHEGKRLNTREYRTRKKLEEERHKMIQEALAMNPEYKPPADYKWVFLTRIYGWKCSKKFYYTKWCYLGFFALISVWIEF